MCAATRDFTRRSWFESWATTLQHQGWRLALTKLKPTLVALVSVFAAFSVRFWLTPVLGEELPFMLFIPAALVAAWYGGAVMGVVALVLGLFLAAFFFVPTNNGPHSIELVRLLRYVFTASLGVVLIEVLHRSKRHAEATLKQLSREMEQRKLYEAQLSEAKAQLSQHAEELEHRVSKRTAELAAAVSSLQDVLHHIAHNLRAPLRAIEGFTAILLTDTEWELAPPARGHLRRISGSAKRMDMLIRDLLRYGRLSHLEVQLAPVSLKRAVEHAVAQLTPQFHAAKAEVKILGRLPEVQANVDLLEEVLCQLLENSIRFVAPDMVPHIQIWAERGETFVRVWIEDEGIGIDPRFHDRIFDAFEILPPSQHNGTGIGLAIVKLGVTRMGGHVGVESQKGSGSRFYMDLPAL